MTAIFITIYSHKNHEQAEAEVVPSTSLVEFEVEVEVEVEVGVEFEAGVEVEVKVTAQNYFFGVGGWWVGRWLEKWRIKQSSNLKL